MPETKRSVCALNKTELGLATLSVVSAIKKISRDGKQKVGQAARVQKISTVRKHDLTIPRHQGFSLFVGSEFVWSECLVCECVVGAKVRCDVLARSCGHACVLCMYVYVMCVCGELFVPECIRFCVCEIKCKFRFGVRMCACVCLRVWRFPATTELFAGCVRGGYLHAPKRT